MANTPVENPAATPSIVIGSAPAPSAQALFSSSDPAAVAPQGIRVEVEPQQPPTAIATAAAPAILAATTAASGDPADKVKNLTKEELVSGR